MKIVHIYVEPVEMQTKENQTTAQMILRWFGVVEDVM